MPITESKLKAGTLTLDGTAFSCQPTNVRVRRERDTEGDKVEVLCGDVLEPDATTSDVLAITAVQDFTDPAGLVAFSWANDGSSVPFAWSGGTNGPHFTGTVIVTALEVGGEVNKRLTSDAEWTVTLAAGSPTFGPVGP